MKSQFANQRTFVIVSVSPIDILKQYWGHHAFRPNQQSIIESVLEGKDTLGILPTGGGKSVCFQIPAIVSGYQVLVISPLIALMHDQVKRLNDLGIKASMLHAGMSEFMIEQTCRSLQRGESQFLYVSPERIQTRLFQEWLPAWNIGLLAVDEAHCISQWGYDFRPTYLQLAEVRELIPSATCLALTASATPRVQSDILEKLDMKNSRIFSSGFSRGNLSYSVLNTVDKLEKAIDILKKIPGSALVYTQRRKRTVMIANALQQAGFSAGFYHAGLSITERENRQEAWLSGNTRIMVCTNAFGMGIDKPDVRVVIHYDVPEIPESYYQEAGRAGRDNQLAWAVAFIQPTDLRRWKEEIPLRFPDRKKIAWIYEELAYYFSIPLHSGLEQRFPIDVMQFARHINANVFEVHSVLRILEQQGYWSLTDGWMNPSQVQIYATREELDFVELQYPDLFEVLQTLFRMYSGIGTYLVSISEWEMARQMTCARDYIVSQLRRLHDLRYVNYQEISDEPYLIYNHNRINPGELELNDRLYQELKNRHTERVEFMSTWVQLQDKCRQRVLVSFFGENTEQDCGKCDLCLLRKQQKDIQRFYREVEHRILQQLNLNDSLDLDTFVQSYSSLRQAGVMKVVRQLLDDRKLLLDTQNKIIRNQ